MLWLERPPDPPCSPLEAGLAALVEEQWRRGLDGSGAVIGGPTIASERGFDELFQALVPRWEAEETTLAAAGRLRARALLALAMAPVWVSNARSGGEAAPEPPFPLPELLGASDPALSALGARLWAQVQRAAGRRAAAEATLLDAIARAAAGGDARGEGLGWLWLGELYAAPGAPLLSLERWLHENPRGTLEIPGTPWAAPAGDDAGAEAAWARAEALLEPVGQAALALGRGLLRARAGRHAEAAALLEGAESAFEACSSPWGTAAARLHGALARAAAGEAPALERARAVGRWGAGEGSRSFALGLGLTALVAARRALEERADAAAGLGMARLAVALLDPLGAPYAAGCALLAEAELAAHAWGPSAALPRLEAAWARGLSLRGGPLDGEGRRLARDAALTALSTALGGRDAEAIEAAGARLDRLRAWPAGEPEPLLDGALAVTAPHAALARVNQAAEAGDREGLERALQALEQASAALPGAGIWRATALFWRERRAEAVAEMLAFIDEVAAREPELPAAPGLEEAEAQNRAALARQRARQRRVERLAVFVSGEQWENALGELVILDRDEGPEGWADPTRPWEAPALRAEALDGAGRLDEAALAWEQAWAAVDRRLGRLVGDAGRAALTGDRGVHGIGRGGERTAARRWERAREAGDEEAAAAHRAEAFRWSERVRARALLDLLAGAHGPLAEGAPEELRRISELRGRLWTLERLLAAEPEEARRAALALRIAEEQAALDALELAHPSASRLPQVAAAPVALEELPALLPPGALFLALDVYDTGLITWAVPAEGPPLLHRARLPRLALPEAARRLHEACARGAGTGAPGEALASLLLPPLGPLLERCERVFVAPSGPLHRVPFAALPWRGRPLVETHTISLLPSASALRWLGGDHPLDPPGPALVVGDPAGMAWTPPGGAPRPLPPLPGAAEEARAVAARLRHATLLTGEAATLEAVRGALAGPRLLHLATHGRYEPEAPLTSALLLARGSALDAATLMGARLEAELVVLSACESGLGEARGGELFGLARALLAAGARRVVQSLWPVDDEATRALMLAFYEALAGGLPPAAALRRAMLALREDGAAGAAARDVLLDGPLGEDDRARLWAPFVIIG